MRCWSSSDARFAQVYFSIKFWKILRRRLYWSISQTMIDFPSLDIQQQGRSHESNSKSFQGLIVAEEMGKFGIEILGRVFSSLASAPIECAGGFGAVSGY